MEKICIIGVGYVGLVSGAGLSEFGNEVTCVDLNEEKINQLNNGEIPIYEPGLRSLVKTNINKKKLHFSNDISKAIKDSKIIFIAVGTPQKKNGEADLTYVRSVANSIADNLNNYKIICTKSTVPVGTGTEIEKIISSKNDTKLFDYVSNPEFLREGSAVNDFMIPDRLVIGSRSTKAFNLMKNVYRPLFINETPIVNTSVETAEMIKYASNAFLALKISYINEIANLCENVGADVHHVAKAMGQDGRISPKFLHPGPGFGGSCFPKDILALSFLGTKFKKPLKTIEAAIEVNNNQSMRMVEKLIYLLDNKIADKKIGILGLAFKPNTDDVREAASRKIIPQLIKLGATIHAYDPVAMNNFKFHFPNINYFENWEEAITDTDACVILTEWHEFRGIDLEKLKSLMSKPVILDTKNILSVKKLKDLEFNYDNVGRKISL